MKYGINTYRISGVEGGFAVHAQVSSKNGLILASAHGTGQTIEEAEDNAVNRAFAILDRVLPRVTVGESGPKVMSAAFAETIANQKECDENPQAYIDKVLGPDETPSEISVDNSEGDFLDTPISAPETPVADIREEPPLVAEETQSDDILDTPPTLATVKAVANAQDPEVEVKVETKTTPSFPSRSAPAFLKNSTPNFGKPDRTPPKKSPPMKQEAVAAPALPKTDQEWKDWIVATDKRIAEAPNSKALIDMYQSQTKTFDTLERRDKPVYEQLIGLMAEKRRSFNAK